MENFLLPCIFHFQLLNYTHSHTIAPTDKLFLLLLFKLTFSCFAFGGGKLSYSNRKFLQTSVNC